MPATRTNRRNNPLRKLRLILGEGDQPLHQQEFADRIGVPVATVRSIEAGRRPMTPENSLDQIAITLFAHWNTQDKGWHLLNPFGPPYEKRHAFLVREFDHQDPYLDDRALHSLIERLLDLFAASDRQQRLSLLIYLEHHLAGIAKGSKLKVDLAGTEPDWRLSTNPNVWGKWLPKAAALVPYYLKVTPISPHQENGGVLDFRARRTFDPTDYPARTPEEVDAMIEEKRKNNRTQTAPKTTNTKG